MYDAHRFLCCGGACQKNGVLRSDCFSCIRVDDKGGPLPSGFLVSKAHGYFIGRKVPVPPCEQGDCYRIKISPLVGKDVFKSRQMIIVSSPFKQSFRREVFQSPRQNVRGNTEILLEFIEFAQPLEGVAFRCFEWVAS